MNMLPYSGFPALPNKMEDMHKQLVALGLNDVEALTARIKKCEAWVAAVEETELTGNPVIYQNALAVPARSLKTTINAIQDLHGQSAPYVGGAGKNQLRLTVDNIKAANGGASSWTGNSKVINNITITILTDNGGNVEGIKLNGTASAHTYFYIVPSSLGGGFGNLTADTAYIINGGVTGSASVRAWHYDDVNTASSSGADAAFTLTSAGKTNGNVDIFIVADTALNNVVVKPMIRLSTESDASFAPWENKCPISGRTEARVDTENEDSTESAYAVIQLGQTVYGADINWDTGVATVKTALVDLGTLTYTQNGTAQSGKYRYSATVTGIKPNTQAGVTPNIKSSQYKAETPNDSYSAVDGITVVNSDIYIYDSTKNTMSVADFKTAMDGVTAEYELATPTTIQLTPTQLQMLKGYNRVSIDNGSIEIKAYTGGPWEAVTRTIKKVTNKTKTTKKRRK